MTRSGNKGEVLSYIFFSLKQPMSQRLEFSNLTSGLGSRAKPQEATMMHWVSL